MGSRWLPVLLVFAVAVGCSRARALPPEEIPFDGAALPRSDFSDKAGIASGAYVPGGQSAASAPRVVNVIVSSYHQNAPALNTWIMARYRRSGALRWYDVMKGSDGCRTGALGERKFVIVNGCQFREGTAACVELDEQLTPEEASACMDAGDTCFEQLCAKRMADRRPALQPVLDAIGR